MRTTALFSLFLSLILISNVTAQQTLSTETIFSRFLVSEDNSLAQMIAKSKDSLYATFCKAFLSEDRREKITLYSRFLSGKPSLGLAKAYLFRGMAYSELDVDDSVVSDMSSAIGIDSTLLYAYYFRGASYRHLNKLQNALDDFNQMLALDPKAYLGYHMRGMVYEDLKDQKKALADYNKTLDLKPDYAWVYVLRANLKFELSDFKGAISDANQAMSLEPNTTKFMEPLVKRANEKLKN